MFPQFMPRDRTTQIPRVVDHDRNAAAAMQADRPKYPRELGRNVKEAEHTIRIFNSGRDPKNRGKPRVPGQAVVTRGNTRPPTRILNSPILIGGHMDKAWQDKLAEGKTVPGVWITHPFFKNRPCFSPEGLTWKMIADQDIRDVSSVRVGNLPNNIPCVDRYHCTVDDPGLGPPPKGSCLTCGWEDTTNCTTHRGHIESSYSDVMQLHNTTVCKLNDGVVCQCCSQLLFRPDGPGTGCQKSSYFEDAGIFPAAPTPFPTEDEKKKWLDVVRTYRIKFAALLVIPETVNDPLVTDEDIDLISTVDKTDITRIQETISTSKKQKKNLPKTKHASNSMNYTHDRFVADYKSALACIRGSRRKVICTAKDCFDLRQEDPSTACQCHKRFEETSDIKDTKERAKRYAERQMDVHVHAAFYLLHMPEFKPYTGNMDEYVEQLPRLMSCFAAASACYEKAVKAKPPKGSKDRDKETERKKRLICKRRQIVVSARYMKNILKFIDEIEENWALSSIGVNFLLTRVHRPMVRTIQNQIDERRHPIRQRSDKCVEEMHPRQAQLEDSAQTFMLNEIPILEEKLAYYRAGVCALEELRDRIAEIHKIASDKYWARKDLSKKEIVPPPPPFATTICKIRTPLQMINELHRMAKATRQKIKKGELFCNPLMGGCGAFQRPLLSTPTRWEIRQSEVPDIAKSYLCQIWNFENCLNHFGITTAKNVLLGVSDKDWEALLIKQKPTKLISSVIPVMAMSTRPSMTVGSSSISGIQANNSKPIQHDSITNALRHISEEMVLINELKARIEARIGRPLIRGELEWNVPPSLLTEDMRVLKARHNTVQNLFSSTIRSGFNTSMNMQKGTFSAPKRQQMKSTVVSIGEKCSTKTGHIRNQMQASVLKGSARFIATCDPSLPIDCCGIPLHIAAQHTEIVEITEENIEEYRKYVDDVQRRRINLELRIARQNQLIAQQVIGMSSTAFSRDFEIANGDVYPTIGQLKTRDGQVRKLKGVGANTKYSAHLEVGCQLEVSVRTGSVIIINRAPTLWKPSNIAMKVIVLRDFFLNGVSFNPYTAAMLNLDFDGDPLAGIFMRTALTKKIALEKYGISERLVHTDGLNLVAPIQDCVVALNAATYKVSWVKEAKAFEILRRMSAFSGDTGSYESMRARAKSLGIETKDNGQQLFYNSKDMCSMIFPRDYNYRRNGLHVRQGMLVDGMLTKAHLGRDLDSMTKHLLVYYDKSRVAEKAKRFFDDMHQFAVGWHQVHGAGISVADFFMPLDLREKVHTATMKIINECEAKVKKLAKQFDESAAVFANLKQGDATYGRWYVRRKREMIKDKANAIYNVRAEAASLILSTLKSMVPKYFKDVPLGNDAQPVSAGNHFRLLIQSGAKGTWADFIMMCLQAGIQTSDSRLIPSSGLKGRTHPSIRPDTESLINLGMVFSSFTRGLTSIEMLWHSLMAREQLAKSSSEIAPIGAYQRRTNERTSGLCRNSQNNIVNPNGVLYYGRKSVQNHTNDRKVAMAADSLETEQTAKDRAAIPDEGLVDFERDLLRPAFLASGPEAEEELEILSRDRALLMATRRHNWPTIANQAWHYMSSVEVQSIVDFIATKKAEAQQPGTKVPVKVVRARVQAMLLEIQRLRHPNHQPWTMDRDFMTEWYLRSELCTRRVWEVFHLTEAGLNMVCNRIVAKYRESMLALGEAVGYDDSTIIGAKLTQLSLNVKHFLSSAVTPTEGPKALIALTSNQPRDNIVHVRLKSKEEIGADWSPTSLHAGMNPREVCDKLTTAHANKFVVDIMEVNFLTDAYIDDFVNQREGVQYVMTDSHEKRISSDKFVISSSAARLQISEELASKYGIKAEEWIAGFLNPLPDTYYTTCLYLGQKRSYYVYIRQVAIPALSPEIDFRTSAWDTEASLISFVERIRQFNEKEQTDKFTETDEDPKEEDESDQDEGVEVISDVEEECDDEEEEEAVREAEEREIEADEGAEEGRLTGEKKEDLEAQEFLRQQEERRHQEEEEVNLREMAQMEGGDGDVLDEENPGSAPVEEEEPEPEEEEPELEPEEEEDAEGRRKSRKRKKCLTYADIAVIVKKAKNTKTNEQKSDAKKKKAAKTGGRKKKQVVENIGLSLVCAMEAAAEAMTLDTGIISANMDPDTKVLTLLLAPEKKKYSKLAKICKLYKPPPIAVRVLSNPSFDLRTLHMSNMDCAQSLFGIMLTETYIISDFKRIMTSYDTVCPDDAYGLMASVLVRNGIIESMNRAGETSNQPDGMTHVAYQQNFRNLVDTVFAETDVNFRSVQTTVMFGGLPRINDNYRDVM